MHARFFEGVSHVRADDSDAALRAFRTAALSADGAVAAGVPATEALRLRDLAWLSLARVYSSTAEVSEPGEASFTSTDLLRLAIEAYDHVSEAGGYRDDARLERAWASLRLKDTAQALASLDDLSAPFVERTPEAHYLRSLVHFSRCELDAASKTIAALSRDYGAVTTGEVERLGRDAALPMLPTLPTLPTLDEGGEPGRGASPGLRAVIKSALAQRDAQRRFELIAMVKAEKEHLAGAPFRASPLGVRVAQELERASSAASDQITALVRARCERFARESREEIEKAARITSEIEAIRGGASKCAPQRPSN